MSFQYMHTHTHTHTRARTHTQGEKGFTEAMSRVPDASYPVLGGALPPTPNFNANAAEFVVPA